MEFNRETHCVKCQRFIDEETVKLKRIIVGPDTYRRFDILDNPNFKYEKICTDCNKK